MLKDVAENAGRWKPEFNEDVSWRGNGMPQKCEQMEAEAKAKIVRKRIGKRYQTVCSHFVKLIRN